MKKRLNTEEIIQRLKNPQEYRQSQKRAQGEETAVSGGKEIVSSTVKGRWMETIVWSVVIVLVFVTLLFWVMSKKRAENLTAALDPDQVKGLVQTEAEFNPNQGVTYVEVREGQDRNVSVSNLGSTLPIISRFNFSTFTDKNFEIIGAAPWALTTNFDSNMSDVEMIRYLLSNDVMIQAFITRADVEPLLEDPQMLRAFAEDEAGLQAFFTSDTVKEVLADPQLVRTVLGSRFGSYLLISKSGKYFRKHVQEAVEIINQSPSLRALRKNEGIVIAVKENPYLKKLAEALLTGNLATKEVSTTGKASKKK